MSGSKSAIELTKMKDPTQRVLEAIDTLHSKGGSNQPLIQALEALVDVSRRAPSLERSFGPSKTPADLLRDNKMAGLESQIINIPAAALKQNDGESGDDFETRKNVAKASGAELLAAFHGDKGNLVNAFTTGTPITVSQYTKEVKALISPHLSRVNGFIAQARNTYIGDLITGAQEQLAPGVRRLSGDSVIPGLPDKGASLIDAALQAGGENMNTRIGFLIGKGAEVTEGHIQYTAENGLTSLNETLRIKRVQQVWEGPNGGPQLADSAGITLGSLLRAAPSHPSADVDASDAVMSSARAVSGHAGTLHVITPLISSRINAISTSLRGNNDEHGVPDQKRTYEAGAVTALMQEQLSYWGVDGNEAAPKVSALPVQRLEFNKGKGYAVVDDHKHEDNYGGLKKLADKLLYAHGGNLFFVPIHLGGQGNGGHYSLLTVQAGADGNHQYFYFDPLQANRGEKTAPAAIAQKIGDSLLRPPLYEEEDAKEAPPKPITLTTAYGTQANGVDCAPFIVEAQGFLIKATRPSSEEEAALLLPADAKAFQAMMTQFSEGIDIEAARKRQRSDMLRSAESDIGIPRSILHSSEDVDHPPSRGAVTAIRPPSPEQQLEGLRLRLRNGRREEDLEFATQKIQNLAAKPTLLREDNTLPEDSDSIAVLDAALTLLRRKTVDTLATKLGVYGVNVNDDSLTDLLRNALNKGTESINAYAAKLATPPAGLASKEEIAKFLNPDDLVGIGLRGAETKGSDGTAYIAITGTTLTSVKDTKGNDINQFIAGLQKDKQTLVVLQVGDAVVVGKSELEFAKIARDASAKTGVGNDIQYTFALMNADGTLDRKRGAITTSFTVDLIDTRANDGKGSLLSFEEQHRKTQGAIAGASPKTLGKHTADVLAGKDKATGHTLSS